MDRSADAEGRVAFPGDGAGDHVVQKAPVVADQEHGAGVTLHAHNTVLGRQNEDCCIGLIGRESMLLRRSSC